MITFVLCVDGEFKMLFTVRYCLTFHTLLYVSIHSYSEPTGVLFSKLHIGFDMVLYKDCMCVVFF
jgi:hypothetical protein